MYMSTLACNPAAIKGQLNRTEGQVIGIGKMVEANRSCSDVLQQIVAARASLQKLGIMLLEAEAAGCLGDAGEVSPKVRDLERAVAGLFKIT